MANTLSGTGASLISQYGLEVFSAALVPLSALTTDYSSEVLESGSAIVTRIIPAAGTPGELVGDHSGNYVDSISDQTTTAVTCTLNSHLIESFAFTDTEVAAINAGVLSDTVKRMVKKHVWALANAILGKVFTAVDTTYGEYTGTHAASTMSADLLAELRGHCVANSWSFDGDKSVIMNSACYTALLKDDDIKNYAASQSDSVRSGIIENVNGFKVIEAPTYSAYAQDNTVAFAADPSALVVALRPVMTQSPESFLSYEVLQDPKSGVVLVYSQWFDMTYRRLVHSFEIQFGIADGVTSGIYRIVSA